VSSGSSTSATKSRMLSASPKPTDSRAPATTGFKHLVDRQPQRPTSSTEALRCLAAPARKLPFLGYETIIVAYLLLIAERLDECPEAPR